MEAAIKEGVKFVYWNYLEGGSEPSVTIADPPERALELEHGPYGSSWIRFLDDLITLAYRYRRLTSS